MPAPITLPVTFPGSRKRQLGVLAISVAVVAIGVFAVGPNSLVGWFVIGLFGLGGLAALVNLHPRASYLTLTESGFEFSSVFRRNFVAWKDTTRFTPISIRGNSLVGWNYSPGYAQAKTARAASASLLGVEAALPAIYGHSAADLARLMNELRQRYAR